MNRFGVKDIKDSTLTGYGVRVRNRTSPVLVNDVLCVANVFLTVKNTLATH
jgi:hypothetical protein